MTKLWKYLTETTGERVEIVSIYYMAPEINVLDEFALRLTQGTKKYILAKILNETV